MIGVLNNAENTTRSQGSWVFILGSVMCLLAVVLNGCSALDGSDVVGVTNTTTTTTVMAANASLPAWVNTSAPDPLVPEVVGNLVFNTTDCSAFLANRNSTERALTATLAEAAGLPISVVTIRAIGCRNGTGTQGQRRLRALSTSTPEVLDATFALYPSSNEADAVAASINDHDLSSTADKHFVDNGLPQASLRRKTASKERTEPVSEEAVGAYCYVSGVGSFVDVSTCDGSFLSPEAAKTDCSSQGATRCAGILLIGALGQVRYATCAKVVAGPAGPSIWAAAYVVQPKEACAPKAKYVLTGLGQTCSSQGLLSIDSASECFNEAKKALVPTSEWHIPASISDTNPGCFMQIVTYGTQRRAPAVLFNTNAQGHGSAPNRRWICKNA